MKLLSIWTEHRSTLSGLVLKNIKTRYAGSILGVLWAFLNPLLLALVVYFVFANIFRMNAKDYYLFIISGMLPWVFFSSSLQEATLSIPNNAAMLKQFSFPRSIIPLSIVATNFLLLVCGLAVVLPFFVLPNPAVLLMLPLLLLALVLVFLFTAGAALALAAFFVGVRDIAQGLNMLLMLWLWLTPVFYTPGMVPKEYGWILTFNPLNPCLNLFRQALLPGDIAGIWSTLCPAVILSAVVFMAGMAVFDSKEGGFLKKI